MSSFRFSWRNLVNNEMEVTLVKMTSLYPFIGKIEHLTILPTQAGRQKDVTV